MKKTKMGKKGLRRSYSTYSGISVSSVYLESSMLQSPGTMSSLQTDSGIFQLPMRRKNNDCTKPEKTKGREVFLSLGFPW